MKKSVSMFLVFAMLFEITYPTQLFALTGGPSQPEVQSFEPVGTSDMVDLSTGDFNYNIPLMDVDGYPINIAYHSGVTMDQEASWVGLGWNINPGVINRNMRGLPDDFAGDNVIKETNMKPNTTWGVAANVAIELFGYDPGDMMSLGIGFSFGFNYNNYTGPSITQGTSVNISASAGAAGSMNGSLGLTSSSDNGLTIQPSTGFSKQVQDNGRTSTSLGISVGTAFNSRAGLQQLTINASASMSVSGGQEKQNEDGLVVFDKEGSSSATASHGVGGTFNFGTATFSPSITNSMKNKGISGSFTLGGELWGIHGKIGVSGFYSTQKIAQPVVNYPAFGYLYSEGGQLNDNALMDFNREKDGSFTENTACLPVTNYTFDTYAVSGQGVGGSYRPFRSEVGYVADPAAYTTNDDASITAELGFGGWVHAGTNISVTDVSGASGKWKSNNNALTKLLYTSKGKGNDYENVYFKEANEKAVESDSAFYADAGRDNPIAPHINFNTKYEPVLTAMGPIQRKKRDKRSKNFSYIKKSQYNDFAVQPVYNGYAAPGHHIAEITTLGGDGSRYIYGIAAYNTIQKDITFSVGSTTPTGISNNLASNGGDEADKGLISYDPANADNSISNSLGIDNYCSKTTTPAYAHSYLLTSVLSPDYVDADTVRGPSDNDFGTYTRFVYDTISGYKWRTPYTVNKASYTEGLKSDTQDDKANYIYGEKELWYLDSVITKNYVAVFHKSDRIDGAGVKDENGGYGGASKKMQRLDSISLYSKADLKLNPSTALPIKRVHFEYTYSLCKGIENVSSGVGTNGKLTLKKIYFSYQNSNKARMSPYKFVYNSFNPDYNLKGYDRWGNYKPNTATSIGVNGDQALFISGDLPASDFPYVEQNQTTADQYSAAWCLKEIQLPSGGKIKMTYESDDYAYVQDKQAMQMFKVVNYDAASDAGNNKVDFSNGNKKFYFPLQDGITDIHKYTDGIQYLYFRFLVNIRNVAGYDHLEYVSGYGELDPDPSTRGTTGGLGFVKFKEVHLKDHNNGTIVNPVVKAAIQYGRLYMPKKVWTQDASTTFAQAAGMESSTGLGLTVLDLLVNSDFTKNIKDAIVGQNEVLFASPTVGYGVGREFVANKSWIRLFNPNKKKLGGGLRVKKIEIIDEWGGMIGGGTNDNSNYGQEYDYRLDDGTSSGVASYEPQLGGDENPFKQPLFSTVEKLQVPDDEFYQEEPFGESFFPNPSVVYSKVTVKNLQRSGVSRHATGKVVHEFYTAKDFPTIVKRTIVNHKREKDSPFSLRSLFKIDVRDYMTAAQGFAIELNDMHGKPKSQKVYQEGQSTEISSVVYNYKKEPYNGNYKLTNKCTTIEKNGNVSVKDIGMFFDMVGDFREDKTTTNNATLQMNIDVMPMGPYPLIVPMMWPAFARQKTRFRSATTTKVIQRFGILEEVVASDLGSTVATKNLAYDAETGDVLLTQTTTNFNDKVYSLKYPAWWYYESMGPAYQNIGFEMDNVTFTSGIATIGSKTAYFREGDELALLSSPNKKGWVKTISGGTIEVINKVGGVISGTYNVRVIRSGKRNKLTTDMANITTETNPLSGLKSNVYENVLQASAVEFSDKRKTQCNCLTGYLEESIVPYSVNPYILGTKGNWRLLKSYTHLTQRSKSNYNGNTNIRKDGMFTSYSPFYSWSAGIWQMDHQDWTYVAQVTEFNPSGEELENKDALGRYSSATFGYNQSMALSVAANSQYKEQGFDGFEDYYFNPCADDHFKFNAINPDSTQSHTGKYSLKVSSGSPKTLSKQIVLTCNDTSGCRIEFDVDEINEVTSEVSVMYGTAPYSYSWTIISGTPTVSLISSGLKIVGSTYVIQVTVNDSKRCSKTTTITRVGS